MPDVAISAIPNTGDPAGDDLLPYVDLSEGETRQGTIREIVIAGMRSQGATGFGASDCYDGTIDTLNGASTMTVTSLVRRLTAPSGGDQIFFSCIRQNLSNGGWFIGANGDRWRFGAKQASNGDTISNFVNAEMPEDILGKLVLVTMTINGTSVLGYVNGVQLVTLTLDTGFVPATSVVTPHIGRTDNTGAEEPATGFDILGVGYVESVLTPAEVADHFLEVMDAGALVDSNAHFTTRATFDGLTSAPSTLEDQGTAELDFSIDGSLSIANRRTRY